MAGRLSLFILAAGLATGLVAAAVIAEKSQGTRQRWLRHMLGNVLLYNLLILGGLIIAYVRTHPATPGTDAIVLLGALQVMAAIKLGWLHAFNATAHGLARPDAVARPGRRTMQLAVAALAAYIALTGFAWLASRHLLFQVTVTTFEVLIIGGAFIAAFFVLRHAYRVPPGMRRKALFAFGAFHTLMFATMLAVSLGGLLQAGPRSPGALAFNGLLLVLYNLFPLAWLRFLRPLESLRSSRRREGLGLTRREQQVLDLIGEGLTNKEIADRLFISVATVKDHNHNLFKKCGVRNRAALMLLLQDDETPYGLGKNHL